METKHKNKKIYKNTAYMQVCWLPVLVYLQTINAKCYLASMQSEISHCPGDVGLNGVCPGSQHDKVHTHFQ